MDNIQEKISRLQFSLSTLRKVAGWSAEELARLLNVTRQTIVNLETGQTKMTQIQYIAIRSILEAEAQSKNNETLAKLIIMMVDQDDISDEKREELKKTVDGAVINVGRRVGSAAASQAAISAIMALIGGIIAASVSTAWLMEILTGGDRYFCVILII